MIGERAVNTTIVILLGIVPIMAVWLDEPYYVTLATKAAILALAGVGLNVALGLGGMVSFGHAAFFGLGGYVAGIMGTHALNNTPVLSWPFELGGTSSMPLIWLAAAAVSGLAAMAIGALSLRTSGIFFIMITLAFAQMIYYFAISWPYYGGEDGLPIIIRNSFPGLDTFDPLQFFLICFGILTISLLAFRTLGASRFGLALRAARDSSSRVAAVGIGVYRLKLTAFVISGMITGVAGALYADLNRFVSPQALSWHSSGEIMVFVILGGVGRICGPVAGAMLYILLEYVLGGISEYWLMLLGFLLLAVVLYARGGLIGILTDRQHG